MKKRLPKNQPVDRLAFGIVSLIAVGAIAGTILGAWEAGRNYGMREILKGKDREKS